VTDLQAPPSEAVARRRNSSRVRAA
jgi:hypothetical protein